MDKQELLKELKDFNNYFKGSVADDLKGVHIEKEANDYVLTATDGYRLKRLRVSEKLLGEVGEGLLDKETMKMLIDKVKTDSDIVIIPPDVDYPDVDQIDTGGKEVSFTDYEFDCGFLADFFKTIGLSKDEDGYRYSGKLMVVAKHGIHGAMLIFDNGVKKLLLMSFRKVTC